MTLLGEVVYERAYYHCEHCHAGEFPSDAAFGLEHKQSTGAREVLSMAGALTSFDEAARDVVTKMTGLVVSASTLQRTAESVGTDIAERRQAGETIGPESKWDWHADATGETVAYVSADATGLLQQGPHAEKAEGRMPLVRARAMRPRRWGACSTRSRPPPRAATVVCGIGVTWRG